MNNQELLAQLYQFGKLPSDDKDDDFPLKEFDELLTQFTLPLDFETAVKLINLSPPEGKGSCGVEWAIVHLVENYDSEQFQKVLDCAEAGEVKKILQIRYDNYMKKHRAVQQGGA